MPLYSMVSYIIVRRFVWVHVHHNELRSKSLWAQSCTETHLHWSLKQDIEPGRKFREWMETPGLFHRNHVYLPPTSWPAIQLYRYPTSVTTIDTYLKTRNDKNVHRQILTTWQWHLYRVSQKKVGSVFRAQFRPFNGQKFKSGKEETPIKIQFYLWVLVEY